MSRYFAEEPCVHGDEGEHRTGPYKAGGKTSWGTCTGVVRREMKIIGVETGRGPLNAAPNDTGQQADARSTDPPAGEE